MEGQQNGGHINIVYIYETFVNVFSKIVDTSRRTNGHCLPLESCFLTY